VNRTRGDGDDLPGPQLAPAEEPFDKFLRIAKGLARCIAFNIFAVEQLLKTHAQFPKIGIAHGVKFGSKRLRVESET
jgi:hypothetical protein